ncbi:MAG TPA: flavocytochrome c [Thermodesulfobacteriota bacterium]|nr:flavocytochrome c [Thermodesulfobacteriota bacterium]
MGAVAGVGAGAMIMEFGAREVSAAAAGMKWDREAGIIIVGTGAAGLSAAIEANKAGADILVLEKMPFLGGNTGISTAGMNGVQSRIQQQREVKSWSVDEFYEWTRMGGDYKNRPDQVRLFARETGAAIDFLQEMGAPFPAVTHRSVTITEKWGAGLIEILAKRAAQLKVPILRETTVTALVADVSGMPKKVLGVKVKAKNGKIMNFRARKAVILATGGFGANPEVVERYDPTLKDYATTNIPGVSTGECQLMAQSLGADTEGINYIQIHPTVFVSEKKRGLLTEGLREAGAILVNRDGERFIDELQRRDVVAQAILKQKEKHAFVINSKDVYHEKMKEYIEDGFVVQAETLEELAQKIGLDPAKFKETVSRYNSYVEAKNDPDFKRGLYRELNKRQLLPNKIQTPPFYSIRVTPAIHHCCGGLRVNEKAQVMDAIPGKVIIERLYAAGEVNGGTHGTNRMGGNSIPDCIIFGRIAGINAAKEKG